MRIDEAKKYLDANAHNIYADGINIGIVRAQLDVLLDIKGKLLNDDTKTT